MSHAPRVPLPPAVPGRCQGTQASWVCMAGSGPSPVTHPPALLPPVGTRVSHPQLRTEHGCRPGHVVNEMQCPLSDADSLTRDLDIPSRLIKQTYHFKPRAGKRE